MAIDDPNATSKFRPVDPNWDINKVQVLEVSHISLARQFAKYGLNKKYSRNLLDWDFELSKIKADMVKYELCAS